MFFSKLFLSKKPISNRFLLALIFISPFAYSDNVLNEGDVLKQVLEQTQVQNWIAGNIDEAQSEVMEASHWDNPVFSYNLDLPTDRNNNAIENSYMLSQEIDLSGRRELREQAAKLNVQSVEFSNQARLALYKAETRQRFFELLYQQQRLEKISVWEKQLAELKNLMTKLEKAGDISGYDLKRLQREYISAVTAKETAVSTLQQSKERLFALWDNSNTNTLNQSVSGQLLPKQPQPLAQLLTQIEKNPILQSLAQQKSSLSLNTQAAENWQIPKFKLGVGAKTFDADDYSDSGLLVSVDVPLPLWHQNDAERSRFQAQAIKTESQYQLTQQKMRGEISALWQELSGLLSAIDTFKTQGSATSDTLIDIATASYKGGEIGILELLDAYREHKTFELELLDLSHKARQTSIELDKITHDTEL